MQSMMLSSLRHARHHASDFGAVALANAGQSGEQTHHDLVVSKAIGRRAAGTAALDKCGAAEKLQMSGHVGRITGYI